MANDIEKNNGEIIIYQSEDGKIRLDVRYVGKSDIPLNMVLWRVKRKVSYQDTSTSQKLRHCDIDRCIWMTTCANWTLSRIGRTN